MSLSLFNPSLRRLAPFHLVLCPALSKPCRSSEFYPNRASLYRIGPLFTHKSGDFGAISVTEAAPCQSRKCNV